MNLSAPASLRLPSLAPSARSASASGPGALPAVTGAPRLVLRVEAAIALLAATLAYAHLGGSARAFAALFLVPDLSMLGYLAGPRVGAAAYNAAHSYVGPALLAALAFTLGAPAPLTWACIWAAHVGFDRTLGYGLKYGTAFGDTHLGRKGWGRQPKRP